VKGEMATGAGAVGGPMQWSVVNRRPLA